MRDLTREVYITKLSYTDLDVTEGASTQYTLNLHTALLTPEMNFNWARNQNDDVCDVINRVRTGMTCAMRCTHIFLEPSCTLSQVKSSLKQITTNDI